MSALLTVRAAIELASHEALVLEWYKDTSNIGTWGIGVTDKSGHKVLRYKDHPTSIEHALEIYVWLLRTNYIPDVLKAFAKVTLNEAQFAAALSFHYNTGAILTTTWVKDYCAGRIGAAREFLETHYLNGGVLQERRLAEAALFFDGKWEGDGKILIVPVNKPSYTPSFRRGKRVDIIDEMTQALAV